MAGLSSLLRRRKTEVNNEFTESDNFNDTTPGPLDELDEESSELFDLTEDEVLEDEGEDENESSESDEQTTMGGEEDDVESSSPIPPPIENPSEELQTEELPVTVEEPSVKEETPPVVEYEVKEDEVEQVTTLPIEAYSQTLEHMITDILTQNEAKNISLAVFGNHSRQYVAKSLDIIKFDDHKFVGKYGDDGDRLRMFFMIEDLIRKKEIVQGADAFVVVKLIRQFVWNGVTYNELLLTQDDLSIYANITGRKVAHNKTPIEEDLRVIVYGKSI